MTAICFMLLPLAFLAGLFARKAFKRRPAERPQSPRKRADDYLNKEVVNFLHYDGSEQE